MRHALGLDRSISVRYVIWVRELVTGNFGYSYFTKQTDLSLLEKIGDNLRHTLLPASVLSIDLVATNTRYARTAMLDVLGTDYIRALFS